MAHILAIESDPDRTVTLRRLVSERLNAEVVVARSTEEAISALSDNQPDLILTSSLLSPSEGDQLAAHLRQVPALDYLPVLTIPPLVESDEGHGNLVSRLIRRRAQTRPTYDLDAVTSRIKEALEQSVANTMRNSDWRHARALLLDPGPPKAATEETINMLRTLDAELERYCGLSPQHERAPRWERSDLPWLESIKLTWGADLRLLNISCSGLLVESGIRMTLGTRTDFELEDCDNRDFVIPARVVRSDVSSVNSLGVKYVTAAVFVKPFEAIGPDGSLPPILPQRPGLRRY